MFARIAVVTALAALAATGPVQAQGGLGPSDRRVTATLEGTKEIPPNASPARGAAEGVLNMATRELRWKLTCSGLSSPFTAAHFHGPALAAQTAIAAVPVPGGCSAAGVEGKVVLDTAMFADLLAGKWYLNIHSERYPEGEIRGQVAVSQ